MPLDTNLKMYTLRRLLLDPSFRREVCVISKQCSGGNIVSNLQNTTNGTGNNVTSNVLQVTEFDNIDETIDSMIYGPNGIVYFKAATPGLISGVSFDDTAAVFNFKQAVKLTLSDPTVSGDTSYARFTNPAGQPVTVAGANAVEPNDFVTLIQAEPIVQHPYKGFKDDFIADGITTIVTLVHNMNIDNGNVSDPHRYEPYTYSITTPLPITNNHLNRTITFPDPNTMIITFAFPPNIGEDARYIINIFK